MAFPLLSVRKGGVVLCAALLDGCDDFESAVAAHLLERANCAMALVHEYVERPRRGGAARQHAALPFVQPYRDAARTLIHQAIHYSVE